MASYTRYSANDLISPDLDASAIPCVGGTEPCLIWSPELDADVLVINSRRSVPRANQLLLGRGTGYVGDEQLAVAQELLDGRAIPRPVYLVLHHAVVPVAPGAEASVNLSCADGDRVLRFAELNQVEVVAQLEAPTAYVADHRYIDGDGMMRRMRIAGHEKGSAKPSPRFAHRSVATNPVCRRAS